MRERKSGMTFVYENFSRELDNTDAAVVRTYEEKLEEFYKKVAGIDMKGSVSEIYSEIAAAGGEMFEGMFGEGAAREIFGESQSVRRVVSAVRSLNRYMCDLSAVIDEIRGIRA